MYQYPYGDTQQLNLDWILTKIKELEVGSGNIDMEEVANALISATYNAATQYRRYDYCFYNGKLYRCLSDTTGAFNPADWQEVLIGDDIPVLTRLINAVDTSLTSLQTTVGNQGNDITNLQNSLGELDSDNIDNASLVVSGTTVTAAMDNLSSAITSEATARGNTDSVIQSALAIVATGNVHDAVEQGRYMYIKGHNTLPEGLYKTVTAIPVDGVLNSTNVTQIITGGFNQLLEESFAVTSPYITWDEGSYCNCKKIGNIIMISGGIMPIADAPDSGWTNVALIPVGYRPTGNVYTIGFAYSGAGITNTYAVRAQSWGGIQVMQLHNNVEACYFELFYFI